MKPATTMKTSAFCLALLATTSAASARIGETKDEIEIRFGPAANVDTQANNVAWVLPGGLLYLVFFDAEGRSIAEGIQAKDALSELTDAQVEKFLNPQLRPDTRWEIKAFGPLDEAVKLGGRRVAINPATDRVFVSSDGTMLAIFNHLARSNVFVANEAGIARVLKAGREKDEERAVGF